jgi:hypothetical protein
MLDFYPEENFADFAISRSDLNPFFAIFGTK